MLCMGGEHFPLPHPPLRYGNFCVDKDDDNDGNNTNNRFTPCACVQGNNKLMEKVMYTCYVLPQPCASTKN